MTEVLPANIALVIALVTVGTAVGEVAGAMRSSLVRRFGRVVKCTGLFTAGFIGLFLVATDPAPDLQSSFGSALVCSFCIGLILVIFEYSGLMKDPD